MFAQSLLFICNCGASVVNGFTGTYLYSIVYSINNCDNDTFERLENIKCTQYVNKRCVPR